MTTSLSSAERQARQNALMTEHGQLVRRVFERKAEGLPPQEKEEEQRLQAVRQELDAPDDGVTPSA